MNWYQLSKFSANPEEIATPAKSNLPDLQWSNRSNQLGKTLKELNHPDQLGGIARKAHIYRAAHPDVKQFFPNDYITLSKKFAIGHADHQAAVEELPYHVLYAYVPVEDVREATNPGEYFYAPANGKPCPAQRIIYRSQV